MEKVYGKDLAVARRTVARLIRRLGLRGVGRVRKLHTTVAYPKGACFLNWVSRPRLIAYAFRCNPDVAAFEDWWELARAEFGGDDFGEFFDPEEGVFALILNGEGELDVYATATHFSLRAIAPTRNGN